MKLREWARMIGQLPPDTPVVFYLRGNRPMPPEAYCDGHTLYPSAVWEGDAGWCPCVLVELGEVF